VSKKVRNILLAAAAVVVVLVVILCVSAQQNAANTPAEVTATPQVTASAEVTPTATGKPKASPTPEATPTAAPTATPTATPTISPTPVVSATPTAVPTATPSPTPVGASGVPDGTLKLVVYQGSQSVVAYKSAAGEWQAIRTMICSTGKGSNTPNGNYSISSKYKYKALNGAYGQYASRIVGGILFHSVPIKSDKKTQEEGKMYMKLNAYNQLGRKASAGCIRMTVRDAKWIYDNCASGTKVEITPDSGPRGAAPPALIMAQPYIVDSSYGWDPTDPDSENPYRNVVTETPVPTPTPVPTATATPVPTPGITPAPTATPEVTATPAASAEPDVSPTPGVTAEPTAAPEITPQPTAAPTPVITAPPSQVPEAA